MKLRKELRASALEFLEELETVFGKWDTEIKVVATDRGTLSFRFTLWKDGTSFVFDAEKLTGGVVKDGKDWLRKEEIADAINQTLTRIQGELK